MLTSILFTDIVGSTGLWADQADRMRLDLAVHDEVLEAHGGVTPRGVLSVDAGDGPVEEGDGLIMKGGRAP